MEGVFKDFVYGNMSSNSLFFTSNLAKSFKFGFYTIILIIPMAIIKFLYPYNIKVDLFLKFLLAAEVIFVAMVFLGYFQLLFS